jgi:hypothetical protein
MQTKETVFFADDLNNLLTTRLPINNSIIPLAIILKTMRYHLESNELSLKKLYSEVKSSELGTRIHISKLIKNNWISINTCSKDSRVKIIKPTAKMLDTFNALSNELRTSRESKNKKILSFKSFIKR